MSLTKIVVTLQDKHLGAAAVNIVESRGPKDEPI
jgi:hypothetical protein